MHHSSSCIHRLFASLIFRAGHASRKIQQQFAILLNHCRKWLACCVAYAARPFDRPRHELALLAVFKNEAHVLKEWVQHYQRQGVTLIVLINNNSTDRYQEILSPFIARGLVVLRHDQRRRAQVRIYNDQLAFLKTQARWLIVCDLDEFVYARLPFATIAEYLSSLRFNVSSIQIPWKIFGSSGHVVQPKEGVIAGFLYRGYFDPSKRFPSMEISGTIFCKSIMRLRRVTQIDVHYSICKWGANCMSDGQSVSICAWQRVSEDMLRDSSLHLNHYSIQSLQYLKEVKLKRGNAHSSQDGLGKGYDYYLGYDLNECLDLELANINHSAPGRIHNVSIYGDQPYG